MEDLLVFGMVTKERVSYHNGHKTIYKIVPKYAEIMARFENIKVEDKAMPGEEVMPLPEENIGVPIEQVNNNYLI